MEQYSVLTYNIGGYEKVHEILEKSPNAEYIYVTDDKSITSETWTVVYVDNPWPHDPFGLCYEIRFNPFRYVHTNIVFRVDGSIQINKNLDPLLQYYIDGGYNIGLGLHPVRNTMAAEYSAWCQTRAFPVEQANKCLSFIQNAYHYDAINYKGLAQYNIMIQRNDKINNLINEMTLWTLKYLAAEGKEVERIDQTIGNVVIQKFFQGIKVMAMSVDICDSTWLTWFAHNSDYKLPYSPVRVDPYYFNQPIEYCPLTIKENFIKNE